MSLLRSISPVPWVAQVSFPLLLSPLLFRSLLQLNSISLVLCIATSDLRLPSTSMSFEVRKCELIWVEDPPLTVCIVGSSRRECLDPFDLDFAFAFSFDFSSAFTKGFSSTETGLTCSFSWSGACCAIRALDRVRRSDVAGGVAAATRGALGAIVRRLLAVRTGRPRNILV